MDEELIIIDTTEDDLRRSNELYLELCFDLDLAYIK